MYLETLSFFGILTAFLFLITEIGKQRALGIIASLLVMLLGLMVFSDGIQYYNGTNATITESQMLNGYSFAEANDLTPIPTVDTTTNSNGTAEITRTEIQRNNYVDFTLPLVTAKDFTGLLLVFLGLYGMLYYTFKKQNS